MSAVDKAKNAIQQAVGKAEEFVGEKTNDDAQVRQGKKDQEMGEARQRGEHLKDAVKS